MDPILKMWMFQNWIADKNDYVELAKNHAYLLGSFYNPEAAKKLFDETNSETLILSKEIEAMEQAEKTTTDELINRKELEDAYPPGLNLDEKAYIDTRIIKKEKEES